MVTTNTPNFSLRKQDKGDTDWHIPLNNNVDDLDDTLPIVDTLANQGSYSPATDQAYFAYDVGLWYRYNGSSWDKQDFGTESTATSANGADFVSPSDDQSGIETALSNASAGDAIYFIAGTYLVDSPAIIVDKEVHLRPWGGEVVVKLADSTLDSNDATSESGEDQNDHIFDVRQGFNGGSIVGITADDNQSNQADYSVSDRPFSHCFRIGGNDGNPVEDVLVKHCEAKNAIRSGFSIYAKDSEFENLYSRDAPYDHLIYVAGATRSTFDGIHCFGQSGKAPIVFGTTGKVIQDVSFANAYYSEATQTGDGVSPTPQLIVRADDVVDNLRLSDIHIDTTASTNFGPEIVFDSSCTVDGLYATGDLHSNVVEANDSGLVVNGYELDIPSATPLNQRAAIDVAADDVTFRDVVLTETSGDGKLRGITNSVDVSDIYVDGLTVDIGRQWLDQNGQYDGLYLRNFVETRSSGQTLNGDLLRASLDNRPLAQDLSLVPTGTVGGTIDGEYFRHDGSNSITADGGSTSATGDYIWSNTDGEWKTVVPY